MQVGFNGGWAAAYLGLAQIADKQGDSAFATWCRERAKTPDKVQIVHMGDAKAKS